MGKEFSSFTAYLQNLKKVWPGKVTTVLLKRKIVPDILTANNKTVGIRIADYVFVDKLLGKFGYPITSTSVSKIGADSAIDIQKIIDLFKSRLTRPDLIIDVGMLAKPDPSLVIDLTTSKPKVLRVGPSKPEQFLKLLNI